MVHGSLFSGIGGFDLAAEWMGWENAFHCEWNEFGRQVLSYYWPNATSYKDIKNADFTIWNGKIDIITGGFPCQPYSLAGKRKGKEDDRHLWPEMLRAIREVKPTYIVGENVSGLINWDKGLVFDEVLFELENEGYETQSFVLPACGLNAPHKRDRLWIIAYSGLQRSPVSIQQRRQDPTKNINANRENEGRITSNPKSAKCQQPGNSREWRARLANSFGNGNRDDANSKCKGLQGNERLPIDNKKVGQRRESAFRPASQLLNGKTWKDFPTQSPVFTGNDGLSSRLDGVTLSKWRRESVKAAGNAIVPQIAYQIFKAIEETEKQMS